MSPRGTRPLNDLLRAPRLRTTPGDFGSHPWRGPRNPQRGQVGNRIIYRLLLLRVPFLTRPFQDAHFRANALIHARMPTLPGCMSRVAGIFGAFTSKAKAPVTKSSELPSAPVPRQSQPTFGLPFRAPLLIPEVCASGLASVDPKPLFRPESSLLLWLSFRL